MDGKLTRRQLLALVAGAASTAVIRSVSQGPHAERVPRGEDFEQILNFVTAEMRSDRIMGDLRDGAPRLIKKIVAENRLSLPAHVTGTLDPKELTSNVVMVGSVSELGTKGATKRELIILGAGDSADQVRALAAAAQGAARYGNSTPIASGAVITAAHIAEGFSKLPDIATRFEQQDMDLGVMLLPNVNFPPSQVLDLPTGIGNEDVHGRLVVIPGIDPDATAQHRGMYKLYSGIAFSVTPAMVEAFHGTKKEDDPESARYWAWANESMCLVIPDGEARPHVEGQKQRRADGMSGSPVFVYKDGRYNFVGVMWGTGRFTHEGKEYSLAFFMGPTQLNTFVKRQTGARRDANIRTGNQR